MSFKRHLTTGIALVLGLAALAGSALAAPPSTPPGQEKKAEKQAEQAAAASQSAPAEQNQGQEQKAENAEQASNGINATSAGVKPSNSTEKNTWCKTGGSGASTTCTRNPHGTNPPDSSKRYGNGQTAAQIATSHGAPAGTDVYGPGNSQPHKVCGKNGHFIDVHAVKSYVGVDCSATATAAATTTTQQQQGTVTTTNSTSASTSNSTAVTASTSQAGSNPGTSATGGVAGVSAESGSPQSGGSNGEAGGVLGAFGVAGVAAGGALPFTGFPLWLVILTAIALIAVGWTLHRYGRPVTRDLV
jgi:hypothetical protein